MNSTLNPTPAISTGPTLLPPAASPMVSLPPPTLAVPAVAPGDSSASTSKAAATVEITSTAIPPETASPQAALTKEAPVVLIPLEGPAASPEAEISGMAWFSDTLVLLPQYPERFEYPTGSAGSGSLFAIEKGEILDFLEGRSTAPLLPRVVPFYAPGIRQRIPGFEGFESVAFSGDRIYLTIEASTDGMLSYLVSGWYEPGLVAVYIDADRAMLLEPQTDVPNIGDESLVAFGRRLAVLYEANGTAVNPNPRARLFDQGLGLTGELVFPYLEYRIGDATPSDDNGRFWVINTFAPSDSPLQPVHDPLVSIYPEGPTHSASLLVERLIELQFTEQGIVFADSAPIQLELSEDGKGRLWSGIARLDERGFLLATDRDPGTLLAFVPQLP